MKKRRVIFLFQCWMVVLTASALIADAQDGPTFDAQFDVGTRLNDHIEFGIAIDPNSSLGGREESQLSGLITTSNLKLQGELPLLKGLHLQGSYAPGLERFSGEDGKLTQFDAYKQEVMGGVSIQRLSFSGRFLNVNRTAELYDYREASLDVKLAQIIQYKFRHRNFGDSNPKDDYLLLDSTSHQWLGQLRLAFTRKLSSKLRYSFEHERYDDNATLLLAAVSDTGAKNPRRDNRHAALASLAGVLTPKLLVQGEVSLFMNDSNSSFYDFNSIETAVVTFWKPGKNGWARLRLFARHLDFPHRQLQEKTKRRRDNQIGLQWSGQWQLPYQISFIVDYQFRLAQTNVEEPIFEFLNYRHNLLSVSVQAIY